MIPTTLKETQNLLGPQYEKCESPSLRLNKFVRLGDDKTAQKDQRGTKHRELDDLIRTHKNYATRISPVLPKNAQTLIAHLEGRLIVNQARGILENSGLCLHPFFGDPYIPGSAVKGVARHVAWCEWNEIPPGEEGKKSRLADKIARTFGYPTRSDSLDEYLALRGWKGKKTSGQVCFFAAVPLKKTELVLDILTCHHRRYYTDPQKEFALDDEAPNPQCFPAVESGTDFQFTFLILNQSVDSDDVIHWLKTAVSDYGMGARTSAGYGWFDTDDQWAEQHQADLEREKKIKEQKLRQDRFNSAQALLESEYAEIEVLDEEGVALFDQLSASFKLLSQEQQSSAQGIYDSWKKRLPKKSSLDELRDDWSSQKIKAIIRGAGIKGFGRLKDDKKKDIVLLLREESGIGAEVWAQIKTGQKGDVAKAVDEIRVFCKKELGLGKMP